ncbi:MAG TPA: phosphatase PAP2 family protein [Thermoanaerobaculia bacterium]|nr:phosphatase PAP2 family protein [Thermoanaerobaculia bacterium]
MANIPRKYLSLLRPELLPLLVLVLVAGGIWMFAELAGEVREGETKQIDEAVLLALRNPADRSDPLGPRWVEEMARDFTALGGVGVLTILTLAVCGFLVLDHKNRAALLVFVEVGGALVLSFLLKHGFQRPRPDLVPHGSYVYTTSFPSGHSMMSAATYLTLGALLARVQPRRRLKAYLLGLAVLLTLVVGFSRVYLGVHWPTDVLAGWTAGGVWALIGWLLARWLQRRGKVETEGEAQD